jgi:hypothetical protein
MAFSVHSWCGPYHSPLTASGLPARLGAVKPARSHPVTRSRNMLIVAAAVLIAVVGGLAVLTWTPCSANAEGSCSTSCKAAYGSCYKKSQDRSKCQAQLQRCLEGCIRSRRR